MFDRPIQQDVDFQRLISDVADYFAAGSRADQLRWCEEAIFAEAYDEDKWSVPDDRRFSWSFGEAFDATDQDQAPHGPHRGYISKQGAGNLSLGQVVVGNAAVHAIKLGSHYAYRTSATNFVWKGREYKLADYKSRPVLVPDDPMWGWFMQRKILLFKVNPTQDEQEYKRVVFGTKDDHYTAFPEKYGFMGRRAIAREGTWKADTYEARLKDRNPRRGESGGKNTVGVSAAQLQNRWDEINEESGLRVKHAPCILMKNRYITDQDSFIGMYLTGSQGTGSNDGSRARPDHVTDHEIYRMFSGKYRHRILANTLFGGADLQIVKVGKRKNNWWNKNQVSRWWRIRNQN